MDFKFEQACHCEEAQPTKQSSLLFALLDCFASLAMTTFDSLTQLKY